MLHQETFFQTALYLNMLKINCLISDSGLLNQHWPLSHAELDFLLASGGSLLYWPWSLQRPPQQTLFVINSEKERSLGALVTGGGEGGGGRLPK